MSGWASQVPLSAVSAGPKAAGLTRSGPYVVYPLVVLDPSAPIVPIGYSLIIAGLTLLWKRIQLLQETMLLLLMVFAISALPVLTVPGWFTAIGRLFPVTSSVASLYGVMLGHRGVTGAWGTGGLVWVAVTAAAYLAAGILVFRVLERITRARGTLGAY